MHWAQHPIVQRASIPWNRLWPAALAFRARASHALSTCSWSEICSARPAASQTCLFGKSGSSTRPRCVRLRFALSAVSCSAQRHELQGHRPKERTYTLPTPQAVSQPTEKDSTPGWVPSSVNSLVDPAGSIASRWWQRKLPRDTYAKSNRSTSSKQLPKRRRRISALPAAEIHVATLGRVLFGLALQTG